MKPFTVRSTTPYEIKDINNKTNVSAKSLAGLADLLQVEGRHSPPLSLSERKGPMSFEMLSAAVQSTSAWSSCSSDSWNSWSSQSQRRIFRWSRRRLDRCADGLILCFICLAGIVDFIGHWIRCVCEVFSNQIFNRFFGNIARFSRIQSSFPTPLSDRTAGWLPCAVFVE